MFHVIVWKVFPCSDFFPDVFIDTQRSKSKHPQKRFQGFLESKFEGGFPTAFWGSDHEQSELTINPFVAKGFGLTKLLE